MTEAPPSLAGRAFAAVALLVGFYALALAIAGGLAYIPYADWQGGGHFNVRIAIFCIIGALVIVWSIVPRIDRFDPPGPRLTPQTQPHLFALLRKVAHATGQEMPAEVYAIADLNAWVAQRGGIMGFGSRRVMGLGLPLMDRLTVAQFAAVVAHEFGHYYGGDTKLGPWLYKTQSAIGRTLENLSEHSGLLTKPFEWYGSLFLWVAHSASRAQELSADALAARTAGRQALIDGLKVLHGTGPAFGAYWQQEYAPLLMNGYRPPFLAGFQAFMAAPAVVAAVEKTLHDEMTTPVVNPHDTHPPLPERLAALQAGPAGQAKGDDDVATTLLHDANSLDADLINFAVGPGLATLQSLTWEDAPRVVWAPEWEKITQAHRRRLEGVTPLLLSRLIEHPAALAGALKVVSSLEDATGEHIGEATRAFGASLSTALLARGWQVTAQPGEPVVFSKDGHRIEPFQAWSDIIEKRMSPEEWGAMCERAGIAELDLGDTPRA